MGWLGLMSGIVRIPSMGGRNDDDGFDRLNHRWSTGILIAFAVIVTTTTYVREKPITCWSPKEFESSWKKYVDSYCWISNTYYLPFEQNVPLNSYSRRFRNQIVYYQWVPLILLVQALLFLVPIWLWRGLNNKTGMDVNDIVETAEKYQYSEENDIRAKLMRFLIQQMHRCLSTYEDSPRYKGWCQEGCCRPNCERIISRFCCCMCHRKFGNYLVILYFITKVMFLVNSVGQLFMLNWFLGQDFSMYGYDVMKAWSENRDWTESSRFPHVSLCDVDIRRLGNTHRYTLQCVLPINLYNERIYLFVWFWFLFISVMTFIGLIVWLCRFCVNTQRKGYIMDNLRGMKSFHPIRRSDQSLIDSFVDSYLKSDGYLVIRLIDINTNKLTMQDFLSELWDFYKTLPEARKAKLIDYMEEEV